MRTGIAQSARAQLHRRTGPGLCRGNGRQSYSEISHRRHRIHLSGDIHVASYQPLSTRHYPLATSH
jgi:hypothetical protein